MHQALRDLEKRALTELTTLSTTADLDAWDIRFLGRKQGELTNLLKGLKDLGFEARKSAGEIANDVKKNLEEAAAAKRATLSSAEMAHRFAAERLDITAPPLPHSALGTFHPLTIVQKKLEQFFTGLGFMVADGPELESDYYNFTAVNIPPNHPARDMQDTFYIENHPTWAMRTHTSAAQVRLLERYGAPLRAIVPGRVFRNEATDARHEHTFFQLEGIHVDEGITFAHLKSVLELTAVHLFGPDTKVRLRPKYYPFVEPGVNGEVTCFLCAGQGCRVCKKTGWLEVFGAGMVHPSVLEEGGIDANRFRGYAFGFGLTRLVMLATGIDDVRRLLGTDTRWLTTSL